MWKLQLHYAKFAFVFLTSLLGILAIFVLRGIFAVDISLQSLLQDFITLFLGIAVEAFPFVVLGVIVSTLVDMFVDPVWVLSKLPKNKFLSHAFIAGFGIVMPVCECGNVPVARRLLLQGFLPSQAIVFLLAAPIVNPITFISTWEAFSFDRSIAIIRIAAGFAIAFGVGILLSYFPKQSEFVRPEFFDANKNYVPLHAVDRWERGLRTFAREFVEIYKLLLFGCALAALTQTLLPRSIIESIGASPFLSVIAMVVLAFVVSICANIDAFFALAYAGTFTIGSLLSFLVFGPMIDMKMLAMLRETFTPKLILYVVSIVALASVLLGVLINILR